MQNKIDFQIEGETIINEKTLTLSEAVENVNNICRIFIDKVFGILNDNENFYQNADEIKALVEKYLNEDLSIVFKTVSNKLEELSVISTTAIIDKKQNSNTVEEISISEKKFTSIMEELYRQPPFIKICFKHIINLLENITDLINLQIIKRPDYKKIYSNTEDESSKLEKGFDKLESAFNALQEYNKKLIDKICTDPNFKDLFNENDVENSHNDAENLHQANVKSSDYDFLDNSKMFIEEQPILNQKVQLKEEIKEEQLKQEISELQNLLKASNIKRKEIVNDFNQNLAKIKDYLDEKEFNQSDCTNLLHKISTDFSNLDYSSTLEALRQQIKKLEAANIENNPALLIRCMNWEQLASIYLKDAESFRDITMSQIPNFINYKNENDINTEDFYRSFNHLNMLDFYQSFNELFKAKKQLKDSLEDFDPNKYPEFIKFASDIQNNKKVILNEVNNYINIKIPLIKTLFKISKNQLTDHVSNSGNYDSEYVFDNARYNLGEYFHEQDIESEKQKAQENIDSYVFEEYDLSGIDTSKVTLNIGVIEKMNEFIKDRLEEQFKMNELKKEAIDEKIAEDALSPSNDKEKNQEVEVEDLSAARIFDQEAEQGQESKVNNSLIQETLIEELLIEDQTNAQTIGDNHEIN